MKVGNIRYLPQVLVMFIYFLSWSCFDAIQIIKNTFPKDTFSASWAIMIVFIKYYSNVNETL